MSRSLWAHKEGRRGINAVRVYERRGQANLYVEWYEDAPGAAGTVRKQHVIRTIIGDPVPNTPKGRALARRICKAMSLAQLKRREELAERLTAGLEALELPVRPTTQRRDLGSLLALLHDDRGATWAEQTAKNYAMWRVFWSDNLGASTRLTEITPPVVRAALRESAAHLTPGTRNTLVQYLKAAMRYAVTDLQWLDSSPIAGLKRERTAKRPGFDRDVGVRLLRALEQVNDRAAFLGHVQAATGRRGGAVNQITRHDVTDHGDHLEIVFRAEHDKVRTAGRAYVYGPAVALYRRLMLPINAPYSTRKRWMQKAHALAGVEWVPRRSWHALKKFFADVTDGMPGRGMQAGTTEATLRTTYTNEDATHMKAVAQQIQEVVG